MRFLAIVLMSATVWWGCAALGWREVDIRIAGTAVDGGAPDASRR